jgi:NAD(P)-dependent dehydrogenase (short-subunit alcohol dehydrogenase family)
MRSSTKSMPSFRGDGAFGRLDGAVNNAGIEGRMAPMHDLTDADYAEIMDVNARGVFFAMRAEIAAMGAAGGAIVNVGSVGSFTGLVGQSVYAASKHAVWALTRSAAVERRARDPHQHDRRPAPDASPRAAGQCGGNARAADASDRPVRHARRERRGDRLALSDASSFVCGQSIGVDGGYSATLGFNPQAALAD